MIHPLDGARLKVIRAQEHLNALNDEIGDYMDRKPYDIPIKIHGNTITVTPAVIKVDPPLRLSCILGDCVCNLRASLDYIAWQLGTKKPKRPLTEKEKRLIAFPIVTKNAEFAAAYSRVLLEGVCDVPTAAMDEIEKVQPYNIGYEFLGFLSTLVNEDKHRLPLFTIAYVDQTFLDVLVESGDGRRTTVSTNTGRSASFKLGTPVPGSPPQQAKDVKVYDQGTVFVAFQNAAMPRVPVNVLLLDIVKCVANIIPSFEKWL